MNKQEQIEEMAFDLCIMDRCKHLTKEECADTTCAHCEAEALYNAGYRKQDEVAREIFEELSATIMPLVESHNKIAENTGDILWGHKADGLETALLALKGIIRKYGVK